MDDVTTEDDRAGGVRCPGCGRARTAADSTGVAWSSEHTVHGVRFVCPDCTRAELRDIEAGLTAQTAHRATS